MVMQESFAARTDHHLLECHVQLDALLMQVWRDTRAGQMSRVAEAWPALSARIRFHLDEEESTILAAFAKANPDEARRIREEHVVMRQLLEQRGRSLAHNHAAVADVLSLINLFRAHHLREEVTMYRWARDRPH